MKLSAHLLAWVPLVLGALVAGCARGGGGGGESPAAPAPAGPAQPPASTVPGGGASGAGPILLSALLEDRDGDGAASAGDAIVLGFDADLDASALSAAEVVLLSTADSLGAGAQVAPRGPREVAVALGPGAALSLYETYAPRRAPNRSPAAVFVLPGAVRGTGGSLGRAGRPVPVVLDRALRAKVQAEQHRGAFSPYRGQIHAHTLYSDGSAGAPADAYDVARFQGGLDFFAVTDHLEYFPFQTWKWSATLAQAEARTVDGAFVALWGYEWGSGMRNVLRREIYNHVNVLSDRLLPVYDTSWLGGFYAGLATLGDDPIAKFNHPGDTTNGPPFNNLFNNWEDYRHDAGADRFFRFVRVVPGMHGEAAGYIPLLDNGWHVAPGFGEDNHDATWGLSPIRMGLFASELTRPAVIEAMRALRSFTSTDRDAWVRLVADDPAGDLWMGSTVCGPGPVRIEVEGGDPTDGLDRLEIVTIAGAVAATFPLGGAASFAVEWTADPSEDAYYYARVTEADGDVLYSAPIFIDR